MLFIAFALIALWSPLAAAVSCGLSGSPSQPTSSTVDPPLFASGSFTAADVLTLNFAWDCDFGTPSIGGTVSTAATRNNYTVAFVSTVDATSLCPITSDLGSTFGTDLTLAEAITWSTAKANCGTFMTEDASGNNDVVTFILQISYVELIYASGANTGSTRFVANNYQFSVTTPRSFTVASSNAVTLFGTTALVTQQSATVSDSGIATVVFTIYSACSNKLSWSTTGGSAFVTISTGGASIASISGTTGVLTSSSVPSPSSGAFAGLCVWTVTVGIQPSSGATCTLSGAYALDFLITYPDSTTSTWTGSITLTSSNVCSTVNENVAAPTLALKLYATGAKASTGGAGAITDTANAVVNSGDTAHWRIDFAPAVGTPVIASWSLGTVCWTTTTPSGTPSCSVSDTVITTALDINGQGSLLGQNVGDASAFFFKYVWDPTTFPITGASVGNIYIIASFTVTYVAIAKRAPVTMRHTAVIVRGAGASNSYGLAASPVTLTRASTANAAQSSSSDANMGLIVGLSVALGVVCIAVVALAIVVAVQHRNAAASAASSVQAAPTDHIAVEFGPSH